MMESIIVFSLLGLVLLMQLIVIAMLTTMIKFSEFYINEKSKKYVFGDDQKHESNNGDDQNELFI